MLSRVVSAYPPLAERLPLPPQQLPAAHAVVLLGYVLGPGPFLTFSVTCVLLPLAFLRPFYTSGDVVTEYTMSSMFLVLWIKYLDHGLKGEGGPRYRGKVGGPGEGGGVGARDAKTWMEKGKWALRLMTTMRGIGWDWRVKNVPPHPEADMAPLQFVWGQVVQLVWRAALKAVAVYVIGFCKAIEPSVTSSAGNWFLDSVVAWCGAAWSWNTIGMSYAAGAAITALLGICEPWEWPPVFGSLGDAWSVRQVWRSDYCATMYKLYSTFFISFCIHWFQSFAVSRHDNGELSFFMMQPVIISVEDFLQWIWRKSVDPKRKKDLARVETLVGYVWTIVAFTFTMRYVMRGWVSIGLIGGGGLDEKAALQLGRQHGIAYIQGW